MSDTAQTQTARGQLTRLATLTDAVYGMALVLVIGWLPLPEESAVEGEVWLRQLFAEFGGNLVASLIGLVIIIQYWRRSNTLLTACDRTDGMHTSLAIASVFFLLLLLYVVRVSGEIAGASHRAGESIAVALIGLMAAAGWWHARRKKLVREGITPDERVGIQVEAFTEPVVALFTLPFAFVSELWWNLAWLSFFPISVLLRRRARATHGAFGAFLFFAGEASPPPIRPRHAASPSSPLDERRAPTAPSGRTWEWRRIFAG